MSPYITDRHAIIAVIPFLIGLIGGSIIWSRDNASGKRFLLLGISSSFCLWTLFCGQILLECLLSTEGITLSSGRVITASQSPLNYLLLLVGQVMQMVICAYTAYKAYIHRND
jgi:hypothetical protein